MRLGLDKNWRWRIGLSSLAFSILFGCSENSSIKLEVSSEPALALAQVFLARGIQAAEFREHGGARYFLDRGAELDPNNVQLQYLRGISYFAPLYHGAPHSMEPDELEMAANSLSTVIQLDGNNAAAYDARGWVILAWKTEEVALPEFLHAAELDSELLWSFSDSTHVTRNATTAVAYLNGRVELFGGIALFFLKRGNAQAALGRLDEARADYDRAIELSPKTPLFRLARGELSLRLGRFDAAENSFRMASVQLPDSSLPLELLGRCLFLKGDFTHSVEAYTSALNTRVGNAALLIQRGLSLAKLNDWREALEDFEAAHRLNPENLFEFSLPGGDQRYRVRNDSAADDLSTVNPASDFLAACELQASGDLPGAIEQLGRCLKAAPEFGLALVARGALLQRAGDLVGAVSDFDSALSLDPGNPRALNYRGNLKVRQERLAAAQSDYEAAIDAAPDFARPYRNLGLLSGAAHPEQALQFYTAALDRDPEYVDAYSDRAVIYKALGNPPAARRDLFRAAVLRGSPSKGQGEE